MRLLTSSSFLLLAANALILTRRPKIAPCHRLQDISKWTRIRNRDCYAVACRSQRVLSKRFIAMEITAQQKEKRLVVVESPAKARTIQKFLDEEEYVVDFCLGHVRDLARQKDVPKELKKADPSCKMGIDVTNGFEPIYIDIPSKADIVERLRTTLANSTELILATDEDREGEAIAWHLLQVLQPSEDISVRRAVFHEITRDAIRDAFAMPRDIDMHLVEAQETRRILDRLAGFTMSPLLWRKIAPKLSAGRVQSVGMALIVHRERERLKHVTANYSGVAATFQMIDEPQFDSFEAKLQSVDGRRVALGRDFNAAGKLVNSLMEKHEATGIFDYDNERRKDDDEDNFDTNEVASVAAMGEKDQGKSREILLLNEAEASAIAQATRKGSLYVENVRSTQRQSQPPKALTTSLLQQEANRKLRFGATETMRTAQSLYERGYITYMRTDSSILSSVAFAAAQKHVHELYGAEYVMHRNSSNAKSSRAGENEKQKKDGQQKFAQEAHEAIRPAIKESDSQSGERSGSFCTPDEVAADKDITPAAVKLYDLIYRRTLESVMAPAVFNTTTVILSTSLEGLSFRHAQFRASGKTIVFFGFRRVNDDVDKNDSELERLLPPLSVRQKLDCTNAVATAHSTIPPPRYSVATFVRELEARGVGRPSTYASIVETLQERKYVTTASGSSSSSTHSSTGALVPSMAAFVVTSLLERHCPLFVEANFTASMEAMLDAIAKGEGNKHSYLSEYYSDLSSQIADMDENVAAETARRVELPHLSHPEADELQSKPNSNPMSFSQSTHHDKTSRKMELYLGPYGVWAERPRGEQGTNSAADELKEITSGDSSASTPSSIVKVPIPPDMCSDVSSLTGTSISALLDIAESNGYSLGVHPDSGRDVLLRVGPYGLYIQHGRDDDGHDDQPMRRLSVTCATAFPSCQQHKDGHNSTGSASTTAMKSELMTLSSAVTLLSLPKDICDYDPSDPSKGPITVGIGKYGPYLRFASRRYVKLPHDEDPLTVTSSRARALVAEAEEKANASGGGSFGVIQRLGEMEGKLLEIRRGRFGPYISWGGTGKNALRQSVPKELHDDLYNLPQEVAWALLSDKRAEAAVSTSETSARKSKDSKKESSNRTTKAEEEAQQIVKGRRKKSAWMFFCEEHRPALIEAGSSFGDATKQLSAMWKDEALFGPSSPGRAKFAKLALADAAEIASENRRKGLNPRGGQRARRHGTRAKSGFQVFSKYIRPQAMAAVGSKQLGPVSQELSRRWRALSEEDRASWAKKAKDSTMSVDIDTE